MSNMQQRRDEILEKRARLEELRRQREVRARQSGRQSSGVTTPTPSAGRPDRREIDSLIDSLVSSRPVSTTPGVSSPGGPWGSRPNSVLSAGELSIATTSELTAAAATAAAGVGPPYRPPAVLTTIPLTTVYECLPAPAKEVHSYSKGVQTVETWTSTSSSEPATWRARATSGPAASEVDADDDDSSTPAAPASGKRLSRRERSREEELRENIRREIEEELRATRDLISDGTARPDGLTGVNFPTRYLTAEEVAAVTSSDQFSDFIERSTKVIERALDQELDYDILTDYALRAQSRDDDDDDDGEEDGAGAGSGRTGRIGKNVGGRGRRRVRQSAQFYDERLSRRRMISGVDFSARFPELVLASYTKNPAAPHDPDGLVQVWNLHMHDRPEFVFTAQSDVLTAKFSPFHPNLIVGGSYSGQVLLWDTRVRSGGGGGYTGTAGGGAPVHRTPLTGLGHAHPVYCVDLVGTQNANNIVSCSTDGVVCGWSADVLAQPQESLLLRNPGQAKIEDVSPTSIAFPQGDPTFFLAGTEEGTIYPCHRYDRAGAKAGVDPKVSYRGHAAPVMSVDFHPARGPLDLGDLVLSSSLDWTVRLWRVRAPAASSTTGRTAAAASMSKIMGTMGVGAGHNAATQVASLIDFVREDVVYDARWSPVRPSVFALVDGAGWLELWDIAVETEEPVARISPTAPAGSALQGAAAGRRSLNKVCWEPAEGKRLAAGGIDGVLTVFDVAAGLGGREELKADEWTAVKRLVNRVEAGGANAAVV